MNTEIVAVVLAGGRDDPLARQAHVTSKGDVPFGGRRLVTWVFEALRNADAVGQVVCVGAVPPSMPAANPAGGGGDHVPAGHRLVDSLALGLGAALARRPAQILVVTADLPYLTSVAVDRFVQDAPEADLVYPIVERTRMEEAYPRQPRTYATLQEGSFTGGNAILLRPAIVPGLLPLLDRAYRARKNPLRLAALVGWDVLVRLVARRLSIGAAEQRISRLLGGEARAWVGADPALAADIDRLDHLTYPPPPAGALAGDSP